MRTDTLVLAHGAFHGPWCWQPVMDELERKGIRCVAIDLNRGGLEPDRAALQDEVDRLRAEGASVSAIGHSLGCPPVAMLDPATVETVLFLAGPVAGPGTPDISGCTTPGFVETLQPEPDGRMSISRAAADEVFYHRCTRKQAEAALDQLRPTFVYSPEATETPIWQVVPATYVECSDDRAVIPEYQRAVARLMPFSEQMDSDHSPMLGQPGALSEVILRALARSD